ncbi:hypothetical protein B7L09_03030 [Pseudomonas mandelii]|uniref:hypothetical protein n=1 Tax=Pseudomonas TaxID=286 RepID=UPI000B97C055|nr:MULTISPECIES: hypothetical protein [Pseudomonas]OYQ28360.1 hypothetical protein B7L09_03030 [Pseudomonas mandelii]
MTAQANTQQRAPGDLDVGFADNGMINIPQGSSQCVVETSAGKLLYVAQTGRVSWIYRAMADGTSDPTFQPFAWDFAKGQFESFTRLLARRDGKFLLIGNSGKEPFIRQAAITRFNEGGSPDLVFGTRILPLPVDPVPPEQGLQTFGPTGCLTADHHVLVAESYQRVDNEGTTIDSAGRVYTLDDQGHPDTGFEVRFKGLITTIHSIGVLSDGRIVVFGIVDRPSSGISVPRAVLACYNRDGTLNKTFGIDGFWENENYTSFGSMVVDDDKIIIAAATSINDDGKRYVAVQRVSGNGASDETFNSGLPLVVDLGSDFVNIPSVTVQPDKKIVVAGSENFPVQKLYWLRTTEGGELDPTFGDSGVVRQQTGRLTDMIVQRTVNRLILAVNLDSSEAQGPKVLGILS